MNRLLPTAAWIGTGLAFGLYPALRPYADETTLAGLAAMASTGWVVAHLLGMAGFVGLAIAVRTSAGSLVPTGGTARWVGWMTALGAALVLPYYGAETFGLHAIGSYATAHADLGQLATVDAVRNGPAALATFGAGLILLAVAGVVLVFATRRADRLTRGAAIAVGAALLLYLPQFFGPSELRVAHGLLLGLGCLGLALARARTPRP